MAILKHGAIKDSYYGKDQRHLLFEHDPCTNVLLCYENGSLILRRGLTQTGLDGDNLSDGEIFPSQTPFNISQTKFR